MSTAIEKFAAFGAGLAGAPLQQDVVHHAKRALIDWYAAALAGARIAPSTLLEKSHADDLDRGPCRLVSGRSATPRTAALINGASAHAEEVDDIFKDAIYHPGAPTIAAAMAAAQEIGASGAVFLRGVVAGYEISTRIGATLGRAHYKYWHNTGTVGTFGAAAAAASIYGLDNRRFAHALGTCGTFAAGLQQAFRADSMSKPLHAGHAGEAGLSAAQMARAGITGALDILDGEAGLGRAMGDAPDWNMATASLGQHFNVTRMTFENHACCGHTFAAIDGALEVQRKLAARAADIAAVKVATYAPALDVAGNPNPVTSAEARFSLPYVVATALVHGSTRLKAFTPERLGCRDTRDLMKRIALSVDPAIDGRFPNRRAADVTIDLRDGRSANYFQPDRKGDPELPLTDQDLEDKFCELADPVIGGNRARSLLADLWRIDGATAV